VVTLISNAAGEGAYRAGVALYEGESAARQDEAKATATRLETESEVEGLLSGAGAAKTQGQSDLLSNAGSIFSSFGNR
jgi:hypothetical protein